MPIYEYSCSRCDHKFEVRQGYDDPKPACPQCNKKRKVKRLISVPALKFVGSGFYCNDYPKETPLPRDIAPPPTPPKSVTVETK